MGGVVAERLSRPVEAAVLDASGKSDHHGLVHSWQLARAGQRLSVAAAAPGDAAAGGAGGETTSGGS